MSFGFSVGDILGGANLAYNLYQSLSATKGSAREYAKLIKELDVVRKVLIQVEKLRESNQLLQETLNALLFTVNTANEAMEDFMLRYKVYEIEELRKTLATMLVSVNCLVTLACLDSCTRINPSVIEGYVVESREKIWRPSPDYPGIRLEVTIYYNSSRDKHGLRADMTSQQPHPEFEPRQDLHKFFRCGQVFSIQITSDLSVESGTQNLVEVAQLPEPVGGLQEKAKAIRLAQILLLPLKKMVQYSEENENDQNMVRCRLCKRVTPASDSSQWMSKDYWASKHFRWHHWKYYHPMIADRESLSRKIPGSDIKGSSASPLTTPGESAGETFLPHGWLKLEGITSWRAIESDDEIESLVAGGSFLGWWHCDGPTMIRRFVVIRGDQSHAFAWEYTRQEEKKVKLLPIRMKAHHPSAFLPNSARMHFGRVYEISHDIPVRPLGLIDTECMELMTSQFEEVTSQKHNYEDVAVDNKITKPTDMTLVEEIGQNIGKVLGANVTLKAPEKETVAPERKKRRV
ncbi:hypothetical protein EG329_004008 [Mollisiaceae sp. DMI_Dod_QoI]|nr:hypothetical protein EG329_004008 [Helotiales sp. DMI_Dod_QoI]